MTSLKVTQIGNSLGVILPKEIISKLRLEKGDDIFLSDAPGGLRLTTHNPEFGEQMKLARAIMKKRKNALHELAK
jgi:putative addiction module antidote